MDTLLSNVSVGVIYDLEGDRSGDIVYLSWVEGCEAGSRVVRGELFGIKAMELGSDCRPEVFKQGLVEEGLELMVFNVYKVDKLLKLIDGK